MTAVKENGEELAVDDVAGGGEQQQQAENNNSDDECADKKDSIQRLIREVSVMFFSSFFIGRILRESWAFDGMLIIMLMGVLPCLLLGRIFFYPFVQSKLSSGD